MRFFGKTASTNTQKSSAQMQTGSGKTQANRASGAVRLQSNRGYVLALVVICVAVVLIMLASLLSIAVSKNNTVRLYTDNINARTEIKTIGEAFIGKKGELTPSEMNNPAFTALVDDTTNAENVAIKRLTVKRGDKVQLVVEISLVGGATTVLRYETGW